ncbi:putative zinc-binding peptidase [Devosia sp. ZB163]|uniref:zinc-binding metallopeptidase family protein n=1 Tax=Devosia sp. ZB163 TaxID=3025938 RepID=UPI00236111FE|nr:putative zinc-binding peptidase [Devosia sp. ZB163]MDC9825207.1 putative zinc-binding peptidase [Devosia sp. ZB163]
MKLFRCDHCGNLLYFENTRCERCGRRLGYAPLLNRMLSLEGGPDVWTAPFVDNMQFVFCANAAHGACNWLIIHSPGAGPYCRACRHNELVPDIDQPVDLMRWQSIERAKKRLVYSLLRLHLPLANRVEDPVHGLGFRFPNEDLSSTPVLTGHASGIITIALKEADDAAREYRRTQFKEPYRTLLGHFRHEIGHYYWSVLVNGRPSHAEFRRLFGDENDPSYADGLKDYYERGAPAEWQQRYISAYATAHPWEDFAETFAHYLHLVDTTEMAAAFGVQLKPKVDKSGQLTVDLDYQPYDEPDIAELVENWVPLSSLINNLNRAVGQHDAYPFVLTPEVIDKLGFVLRIIHEAGTSLWTVPGPSGPIPINVPITQ